MHGELLNLNRILVKPLQQPPHRPHPTITGHPKNQPFLIRSGPSQNPHRRPQLRNIGKPKLDIPTRNLPPELPRSPLSNHLPPIKHRDLIGELINFLKIPRSEKNGDPISHQLTNNAPHSQTTTRIKPSSRLIKKNNPRPTTLQMMQVRHKPKILPPRQNPINRSKPPSNPNNSNSPNLLSLGSNIKPTNTRRPPINTHQGSQHIHNSSLPSPMSPKQSKNRTRTNIQINTIKHNGAAINLPKPKSHNRRTSSHTPSFIAHPDTTLPHP